MPHNEQSLLLSTLPPFDLAKMLYRQPARVFKVSSAILELLKLYSYVIGTDAPLEAVAAGCWEAPDMPFHTYNCPP